MGNNGILNFVISAVNGKTVLSNLYKLLDLSIEDIPNIVGLDVKIGGLGAGGIIGGIAGLSIGRHVRCTIVDCYSYGDINAVGGGGIIGGGINIEFTSNREVILPDL